MTDNEKKDLQQVEIRHKSGRISMLYLQKKTVALWDQIRKENPELSGEETLTMAFKIQKEQEKK